MIGAEASKHFGGGPASDGRGKRESTSYAPGLYMFWDCTCDLFYFPCGYRQLLTYHVQVVMQKTLMPLAVVLGITNLTTMNDQI